MGEKQKVFLSRFYKVTVSHLGISVWEWKLEFLIKIGAISIAYSWQEKLRSTGVVFITQKCLLTQICTHRIFIATENEFEKKLRNYVYFHYIKFTWKWFTLLCAACPLMELGWRVLAAQFWGPGWGIPGSFASCFFSLLSDSGSSLIFMINHFLLLEWILYTWKKWWTTQSAGKNSRVVMADDRGMNWTTHRLWQPRADMLCKAEIPTS